MVVFLELPTAPDFLCAFELATDLHVPGGEGDLHTAATPCVCGKVSSSSAILCLGSGSLLLLFPLFC